MKGTNWLKSVVKDWGFHFTINENIDKDIRSVVEKSHYNSWDMKRNIQMSGP